MASTPGALAGTTILIVEDEYFLADDLARDLQGAGAAVVGPVGSRADAERAIAAGGFDAAVLDLNLDGELSFAVAERLRDLGVPFVIVSGYGEGALPSNLIDAPRLTKPAKSTDVIALLASLLAGR